MAAPRPKKKPPVKKKTDVKSPAETRKSISRKQVGTTRPARGDLGARAQYLKYGPTQPQGPEAPTYREKIGPVKPNAADPKRPIFRREGGRLLMRKDAGSVLLKRSISKIPVVGTALGFIADAAPAGEGSTKDKYSTLKKKYSSDIGPKQPAGTKKSSGFGKRISEGAKFERLRASRAATEKEQKMNTYISAAIATSKMSGGGVNNPSSKSSTYSGYGNFKTPKVQSSSSNTTATSAAASASSGTSKAAKVGGKAKTKTKVGKQTKYQRNELAMEQRKRSSGKPKKSIFSLFRKG